MENDKRCDIENHKPKENGGCKNEFCKCAKKDGEKKGCNHDHDHKKATKGNVICRKPVQRPRPDKGAGPCH